MALTNDDKKFITDTVKSTVKVIFDEDRKYLKVYLDDLFDIKLEEKLEEKFKDKLGSLPSKEEFYEQIDKLMKELKDSREEHSMLSGRTYDNTDRLDQLEKIHPDYTHVAFAS